MNPILIALRDARLIAKGMDGADEVYHYLLKDGCVLEVVLVVASLAQASA